MEQTWRLLVGDVRETLRSLPEASVHCVVTSPPYWGLRDYGTGTWEGGDPACEHKGRPKPQQDTSGATKRFGETRGQQPSKRAYVIPVLDACRCGARRVDQQIGLEPTPAIFVATMVDLFRDVRRVLRDDRRDIPDGLKPKDLVGIPWRVALALQADGWYLRSDIVWHKPNPMPESVTDRPTKSHEYIFLLTKSERYFYDAEAIKEQVTGNAHARGDGLNPKARTINANEQSGHRPRQNSSFSAAVSGLVSSRNRRSVWTITTQPYPEAHFATFPEEIPETCIAAGTSERGACGDLRRAVGSGSSNSASRTARSRRRGLRRLAVVFAVRVTAAPTTAPARRIRARSRRGSWPGCANDGPSAGGPRVSARTSKADQQPPCRASCLTRSQAAARLAPSRRVSAARSSAASSTRSTSNWRAGGSARRRRSSPRRYPRDSNVRRAPAKRSPGVVALLPSDGLRDQSVCRLPGLCVEVGVTVRTVCADPPWGYRDQLSMSDTKRSSASQYSTMTVRQICDLCECYPTILAGHEIAKDAFLFLWVTNPILLDGTGARVCRAWGFEPRQLITWVKGRIDVTMVGPRFKPQIGMGHFTRGATEHLILATRGRAKQQLKDRGVANVFISPRTSHSTKPDEAFALIERTVPGPYLELFARKRRENWTGWGAEYPTDERATA